MLLEVLLLVRDATGKFPDYPDEEEGGSEAIFKKREEPVSAPFHYNVVAF